MPYPASYLCFKELYFDRIQVYRALQDVAPWVFQEVSTRAGEKLNPQFPNKKYKQKAVSSQN